MAVVFVDLGQDVQIVGSLEAAVNAGVSAGYREGYLRKSVVSALGRENTGDNTPAVLHLRLVEGDGLELTVAPKGFGSENMSRVYMLTPAQGEEGVLRAILETVVSAGACACPPCVVGVGIGSTMEGAALLAKRQLLRLLGQPSPDPEAARRAGILHDCTKYLDLAEQLKLCDEYGIVLDDLEQKAVKLLHSKTGAAIARHVYGAPDEVCDAIYWHTTGKADMTLLEKVLYLADYIEPSREEFPGLKELRRLAYEDLDQALLLGCRLTIEDMEERGVPVHTNTLQARDWLKGRNP